MAAICKIAPGLHPQDATTAEQAVKYDVPADNSRFHVSTAVSDIVGILRTDELHPNMQAAEYLEMKSDTRIGQTDQKQFEKCTSDCPMSHDR